MPSICDLPTELRQRILAYAMPDTNFFRRGWPQELQSLLRINKRLKSDMIYVVESWSPIHYVARPEDVAHLQDQDQDQDQDQSLAILIDGQSYRPKISRICLGIFGVAAEDQQIPEECWDEGSHSYCPSGYWAGWYDAIAYLPLSAAEVSIDIVSVPTTTERRTQHGHGLVSNHRIEDERMAGFLKHHADEIATLFDLADAHYAGRLPIRTAGPPSDRKEDIVDMLNEGSGAPSGYEGIWVVPRDVFRGDIKAAARQIARSGSGSGSGSDSGKRREGEDDEARDAPNQNQFAWLRHTHWSRPTCFYYAKVAKKGGEPAAFQELRDMAEFINDDDRRVLRMEQVEYFQRALQRKMAEDLGLLTSSEIGVAERRVTLTKPDRLPATEE